MKHRTFLFLQGPTSPFFSRLTDKILSLGAQVHRINFNAGDFVYWGKNKPAWNFRGNASELPEYLEDKLSTHQITDIIMVGDTRPVNSPAVYLAKKYAIRLHIFEEGYFRPNWLTMEEDGINGHSRLPKDPDWYREVGEGIPSYKDGQPVKNPTLMLAAHEIGYHFPNIVNPVSYKGYHTHRPHISGIELAGWGYRFAKMPYYEHRDKKRIGSLLSSKKPFFILPLQLDSDSQIQRHSAYGDMATVIQEVMRSFAHFAPKDSILLIKNHPLDTGFTNFSKIISGFEKKMGIEGKVVYLESGHLPTLLNHCEGLVTVNSTVGNSALIHNCRTLALSDPIFNLPGLTAQCTLDQFWNDIDKPDGKLFRLFRNTVIHTTQINGGFYSESGITLGVEEAIKRLQMPVCPLEKLLEQHPPRF
ncbi:capsule biosynthesis protein [Neptunomonas japonica]|uniref:capsule biosynthesis protein n=1 Tax=Neptunomonas japonica TaxID=417574 RepID=UPI00048CBF4F|nr:capsular biosynthesis protein [Neptunomonas japonica]